MEFVEHGESLEAALVRTQVFGRPRPGDEQIIQAEIERRLAKAKPDRPLRAGEVLELLKLGLPADDKEVARAIEHFVTDELEDDGSLDIYKLRAVCLAGGNAHAELRDHSLKKLAERATEGIRDGCPWTPIQHLKTLWAGRGFVDVEDAMATDMRWIAEGMNEACSLSYKDFWGFVDLAATVRNDLARRIAEKLMPVLLRRQTEDGGWPGDASLMIFPILVDFGMIEPLRQLPPLPVDWRIVRTIPAPDGELRSLAYDGRDLLTCDESSREVVAFSLEDGTVRRRLALPDRIVPPLWVEPWNGSLALVSGSSPSEPGKLFIVDAGAGDVEREIDRRGKISESTGVANVDGRLWVGDGFDWVAMSIDPAHPDDWHRLLLACPTGPAITFFAVADDGVWHFDECQPCLVKSAKDLEPLVWNDEAARDYTNAPLLDWGEKPFPNQPRGRYGIAWDGEHLWALDAKNKRVDMLEKNEDPGNACPSGEMT
jgi:hypothetical protein